MRNGIIAIVAALVLGMAHGAAAVSEAATVAESKTAHEVENIALVKAFIGAWDDVEKAAEYLSEDAVLRMEDDKPAVTGRQAFVDAFNSFMQPGMSFSIDYHSVYARNQVVVTHRVDTVHTEGKDDQPFEVVGLFKIKDGKIVEWTDYLNH